MQALRRGLNGADTASIAADYLNPDTPSMSLGRFSGFTYDEGLYQMVASNNTVQFTLSLSGPVKERWLNVYRINGYSPTADPAVSIGSTQLTENTDYVAFVDKPNQRAYVKLLKPIVSSGASADQLNNGPIEVYAPGSSPVSIAAGWNLLDVPAQNTGITSTAALASSFDSSLSAGDTRVVAMYTAGRFSLYVPGYSAAQPLAPWQGVMVLSQSAGSWNVTGNAYTSGTPVPLAPGWNLVAAPFPASGLSASTVGSEASNCNVHEIALYASGAYHTWRPSQRDIIVPSTGGMWVQCTASQTWTPS